MINEPHAVTAETADFFSRDDVTYLARNRVSFFPFLAKGQKNVKELLVCFFFFVPGQQSFSLSAIFLSPEHVSAFLGCVFVRDK